MMNISKVIGREIYDSRGIPTIECEITLENGQTFRGSAASGTSKGSYEAFELRDNDKRLMGKGVSKAIEKLESIIAPELVGQAPEVVEMDMHLIDLDGTENKSNLGANTLIATSIAVVKAQAAVTGIEVFELLAHLCDQRSVSIPFPLFNVINGGVHARTSLPIQEIMIVPVGAATFRESMEWAVKIFNTLGELLLKQGERITVGYEGGYAPDFSDVNQALDLVMEAIAINKGDEDVLLALDFAANQFFDFDAQKYQWGGKKLTTEKMLDYYMKLAKKYPLYAIEDPFAESDWEGWQALTKELEDDVQVVGDDIFATNPYRISQGIENKAATAAIIKPNQIGTVTETLQSINLCKEYGMQTVISHRSGETEDTFIVDLVVGTSGGHIKAGGPSRGERVAKYNQLLRIEDSLMLSLMD